MKKVLNIIICFSFLLLSCSKAETQEVDTVHSY
mgnify:CR=1 FL=1|jgi:hypothetical protein